MAKIKFPKKEIEKEFELKEDFLEKINNFGTSVENVNEEYLELEILPNRPDLLSLQGFIRAMRAFTGKEPGLKSYSVKEPERDYEVIVDQSVKEVRPYTACAIVKGLNFNDERIKSIIDIQEKLHLILGRNRKKLAIGIYPLEKISLPIRYEARKPEEIKFIPLDSDCEMNGRQILQHHPTGREYARLLENCKTYPIFIDSSNKILSMPPIINSNETGKITTDTKDIFIECSGFDFQMLQKTLAIIVTTLSEMGGKIYSMKLRYNNSEAFVTPDLKPEKIKINPDRINRLLGLNLQEKDLKNLLPKMGMAYSNKIVKIPAYRTDILNEVDIAEDIAIAYGMNNFKPELPNICGIAEENTKTKLKKIISEILSGIGCIEILTYHLVKKEDIKYVPADSRIELENSKTDYKYLRTNLFIPALRVLSENKDNEYPQKVYEIGTIFLPDKRGITETGIKEMDNLLVAVTPANFTDLKMILDYLFRLIGIQYKIKESTHPILIEGRTGSIFVDEKEIGFVGEVHPSVLLDFNIKMPVALLEISFEQLFSKINKKD